MFQEADHIKNTVALIFQHIFQNSEVAWVLISLGTQFQLQIILEPDYLSDYLTVYYDYDHVVDT